MIAPAMCKPDAPVAAEAPRRAYVLLKFDRIGHETIRGAVLAVSEDQDRLDREATELRAVSREAAESDIVVVESFFI